MQVLSGNYDILHSASAILNAGIKRSKSHWKAAWVSMTNIEQNGMKMCVFGHLFCAWEIFRYRNRPAASNAR